MPPRPATRFLTGYPGFIGKRLLEQMVRSEPDAEVFALAEPRFAEEAARLAARLGGRVEVLSGDVADLHLGLSGEEYGRVTERVTEIFHLAAASQPSVPRQTAWRVNVEGTRNVIELARDCPQLQRLHHMSTCWVAGDRVGIIAEDELDEGQAFRNPYEETKFQGEKLIARAAESLPVAILLVMSPLVIPLPLPGDGVAPLNVAPVDFVVQAIWQISQDPRAIGRTFHLVDPNPMSARRVYELIAERAGKRIPKFTLSARAADVVLRLPFLERVARPQRAAISYVNQLALFRSSNTQELLEGTGIQCPPLINYLDTLTGYVREFYRKRQETAAEVDDPLDHPA